ncbi:MAG: glycosyltransferase family 2 protein [Acidimicrobiia bacterium]|nr:glycosyltransferase family 2 protein [Acidimicrobiia bacterium]
MNDPPEQSEIALSVVVVAHDMERELPRTLRSLACPYQRNIDPDDYEVVVVDNGSSVPLEAALPAGAEASVSLHRIEGAAVSPVRAANQGISRARGAVVGLIIDGARMVSPGLLAGALRGAAVAQRAVVTAPAWHLGPGASGLAEGAGYDEAAEDKLLEQAGWETDGYGLFSIATPAASSARGLFGAMGESSSLFLHRQTWDQVGGLDDRFALPGGGMVNHDLYRRVCALDDAQLVVLLGEGTFHQTHGGAATSGRLTQEEMRADYEAICGRAHRPPSNQPLFLGSVTSAYLPYLAASVGTAQRVGQADEGP